jgi:hypothetical protein
MKLPRPGWCLPFRIGETDGVEGPRFGGAPPAGVVPRVSTAESRYLMTIPWGGGEVSVFIGFDPRADDVRAPWVSRATIFDDGAGHIQAVAHAAAPRGTSKALAAFPGRALSVEPETADVSRGWPAFCHHKIGGQAVFGDADEGLLGDVDALAAQGFAHAVQLSLPGPTDASPLGFSWPFGEDIFHLFLKDGPPMDFRFVWA